jgi:N-acetylglucosamine-6-sulfatase
VVPKHSVASQTAMIARRHAYKAAAALGLVLILLAGRPFESGNPAAAARAARPPNFLVILVDDQAKNSFSRRYMPRTFRSIVDRGTTFSNGLAAPPLCCPDRAGILTGQYPHNHGVFSNRPGYPALKDPANTLPVWLRRAGYRTGLIGEFLNRYPGARPAPGFDRWFKLKVRPSGGYYGYSVSDNGRVRQYGDQRGDYSTDVLTRTTRQFLDRRANSTRPFFLWLTYNAPHVAPRSDVGPCRNQDPIPPDKAAYSAQKRVPLPRPPSFDELRVSDKPKRIRSLPRFDRPKVEDIVRRWHCTLAAMREVDSGVGRVMSSLRRDGELGHTIVFYLSDNGYLFGEHRIPAAKGFVYQPALEVPYVVRVPSAYRAGPAPARTDKLVTNQDVAPTLLDYAGRYLPGVEPCAAPARCRRMDGRSLAPLLGGAGWPDSRGVLVEIDSRLNPTKRQPRGAPSPECGCAYAAVRTSRFVYSELVTGESELYDLKLDPDELRNVASSAGYAAERQALASRLDRLRQCSGIEGRDLPSANPFCE